MKNKEMRVLVLRPGEQAEEQTIVDTLQSYYKVIDTDIIQIIPFPGIDNCVFVLDEEGKLKDESRANLQLPEYGDTLVGTVVIAGDNGMGELKSLTDEQIAKILPYVAENDISDSDVKIKPNVEVYAFGDRDSFFKALFSSDEADDDNCM